MLGEVGGPARGHGLDPFDLGERPEPGDQRRAKRRAGRRHENPVPRARRHARQDDGLHGGPRQVLLGSVEKLISVNPTAEALQRVPQAVRPLAPREQDDKAPLRPW